MKSLHRRITPRARLGLGLAFCVAALGPLAGCEREPDGTLYCDNGSSMIITHFTPVTTQTNCTADPMSMVSVSNGTWDVGLVNALGDITNHGFWLAPVVQNNLIDRQTATTAQRDQVQLIGYNVQVSFKGQPIFKQFVSSNGGVIEPAGGKGASLVEVIPPQLAREMDPGGKGPQVPSQALVHIQPVGLRANGHLYGACTDFPVTICHDCLVNTTTQTNPGCDVSQGMTCDFGIPACPSDGYSAEQIAKGGCFGTQDEAITCCYEAQSLTCGSGVRVKSK